LQKLGWRPRRTIILASWDAEEYGLVGSTEWVEDNKEWLQKQAIAYVNVDEAVTGGKFHASASPLYKSLLYSVAHKVPYLDTNQTVYEHWVKESTDLKGASDTKNSYRHHKHSGKWPKRPPVPPLGSGSDYTAFNDFAGISSVDLGFSGPLAIYHSNYDSFKFVETFTDPGFKLHKTLTQVWGLLTIELADLPLVPFNPITYAWDFKRYVDDLESLVNAKFATHPLPLAVSNSLPPHKKTNAGHRLVRNLRKAQHYLLNSAYRYVSVREAAVARFGADCKVHKGHRQKICAKAFNTLNSQVSFFERHLLDEAGLPGRSWFKNVVVSPGLWKGYGSQTLPGLTEAAADGDWKRFKSLERRTAHIISNGARVLRRTPHYA
ncbi:Vacuolar protein sorting-associated protein 70, partial [Dipsacomyces acuminosporus]